jgi:haloalkane dehalogenase
MVAHEDVLRTPDHRFRELPGYDFTPRYTDVDHLRMHYLDEGPANGAVVLMLHGEPSWSYLYRKMIPPFVDTGYRVICPDLIGFGRSDKLRDQRHYSYAFHRRTLRRFLDNLELSGITLVCQDWGGLLGLRLAVDQPERFRRIVAANTMLPGFPGDHPRLQGRLRLTDKLAAGAGFGGWLAFSQLNPFWRAGQVLQLGTTTRLPPEVVHAYDAPFPDRSFMAGARIFPRLVPTELTENRAAWQALMDWDKPFLTAFSDKDPIMSRLAPVFQELVPGARGEPHATIAGASHFLQEDRGEELAARILDWLAD